MIEFMGVSWAHIFAQLATLSLILSWLVVTILALRRLLAHRFDLLTTLVWAALIVSFPFVVAIAFLRAPLAPDRQPVLLLEQ